MKSYEYLELFREGAVLHVRMAREPVNAFNVAMYVEMRDAFATVLDEWPDARAVVLSSACQHFCAGNDFEDFKTMTPENARERMFHVREAFFAIQDCALPVIGAVHGAALGTGLAIAASCDIVIAAEGAQFGLPEIAMAVMGGASHLSRLVPQPLVRRMFLTGRPVELETLYRVGGIDEIVPREELLSAASSLAADIAAYSPTALRVAKHVLNAIETMDIKRGYEFEQGWSVYMSGHPDQKEAVHAFKERRKPDYASPSRRL